MFDVAGVAASGERRRKRTGSGSFRSLARCQHVADAVVGDVEFELPVGRQIGDGDEHVAAFDGPGGEPIGDVPGEHATGDRAADDERCRVRVEQIQFALEVGQLLVEFAFAGREAIELDRAGVADVAVGLGGADGFELPADGFHFAVDAF